MLYVISLMFHNLIQSTVAGIWLLGLQRFSGPLSPIFLSQLLGLSLVLPVIIPLIQLSRQITETPVLFRIDLWSDSVVNSGKVGLGLFAILVLGTGAIFLFQELLPVWKARHGRMLAKRIFDERLQKSLQRVRGKYVTSRKSTWRINSCRVFRVDVDTHFAAVSGFFIPELLISQKFLSELSDDELDAVLTHELAHLYFGDNGVLFFLWCFRGLQCLSPAALVLFRNLIETREQACDALATWILGDSQALITALVKINSEAGPPLSHEITHHAEQISTAKRISALQFSPSPPISRIPGLLATLILGGILWAIH